MSEGMKTASDFPGLMTLDRRLLDLLPAGVSMCNAQGSLIYFNQRAVELWGTRPRMGQPLSMESVWKFFEIDGHPLSPDELPLPVVLRTKQPLRNRELVVQRLDGTRLFVSFNTDPLLDGNDRLVGAVNVFQDITLLREGQAARGLLAAIVESSDDAIVGKSLDGRITSWNAGAEQLYGYTAAEVIGQPVGMLLPADQQNELPAILKRLQQFERVEHYDSERMRKDGTRILVSVTVSPIRDGAGRLLGVSAIARNITERREAERRLRENEEHLRLALEAGRMGSWVWNIRTNQVDWSSSLEAIHGLAPGSFPGTFGAYQQDIHPDDRDLVFNSIRKAVETRSEHHAEYRIIHADGSLHWVEARGRVLLDSQGDPAYMAGICMEITDRKRAEQDLRFLADASATLTELEDYESALNSLANLAVPAFADWCAVDVVDAEGTLQRIAVAHVDPQKRELGKSLHQQFPPDPNAAFGIGHVLRTGQSEIIEQISDHLLDSQVRDPELRSMLQQLGLRSYLGVPLKTHGKTLGVLTFLSAESGRRYTAHDLTIAEDLAHRAAVAIENAGLYQAVREADRRKDEFLAMLAHELRNPLAPIRIGLDLLSIEAVSDERIQLMREQVDHLARLVDDLLDVARIMRGKIQLRPEFIDLKLLVQRAIDAVMPFLQSRRHSITVSLPAETVPVFGDPVRVTQVVSNLLHNAIKYTNPGGQVWLTLTSTENEAVLSIKDNGVGLDAELLPRVFDLFTQADRSLERSEGGLGIGLTLVKSLVELHRGTVCAQSAGPGEGCEFVVRLPLTYHEAEDAAKLPEVKTMKKHRILIVDDNRGTTKIQSLLLAKLGDHEICTAHDGPRAIETAKEFHPDLILLDIGLPQMSGFEVARQLRSMPEFQETLLVALTGYGSEEDRRQSLAAGFDVHLVKPPALNAFQSLLSHPKLAST
jgi:PAS domain S-box-containing protein